MSSLEPVLPGRKRHREHNRHSTTSASQQTPGTRTPIVVKGDIAPPDYTLMPITNTGGMDLNHFANSPFAFVQQALADLHNDHYDLTPDEQLQPLTITRKSIHDPWVIPPTAPNSAKYIALTHDMIHAKLVTPIKDSDFQKFLNDNHICSLTVLTLFGVVKCPIDKTTRPIENGHPSKPPHFSGDFSLPGADMFVRALLTTNTAGMVALHGDLSNYYFQIPLTLHSRIQHAFRIDDDIFVWNVLTMGWFKATRIAESLCLDLCLRGSIDLDHSTPTPNGLVRLKSGGFLIVIYDSFLLLDKLDVVNNFEKRLLDNCKNANATLKYHKISKENSEFEFCGFALKPGRHTLRWKIADSTLATWKLVISQPLPCSPRTLWRLGGALNFAYSARLMDRRLLAELRQFQADTGKIDDDAWDTLLTNTSTELVLANLITAINDLDNSWLWKSNSSSHQKLILRATSDATPKLWSYTLLSQNGVLSEHSGSLPCMCTVHDDSFGCTPWSIETAEAYAMSQCFLHLFTLITNDNSAIIITCGDNQPVLQAFRSGASSSIGITTQIHRSGILSFVRRFPKTPIILVDLPSAENYADIATRPDLVWTNSEMQLRLQKTLERLNHALLCYNAERLTYIKR